MHQEYPSDKSKADFFPAGRDTLPRWQVLSTNLHQAGNKLRVCAIDTSSLSIWSFCESESPAFQWIILLNCHFEKFSTSHLLLMYSMYSERKTHSHQDTNDPFAGANYFDCVRKWIPWTDFCARSAGKRDPRGVLQLLGWRDRDIPTRSSKCVERIKYHDPRVIH